MDVLLSVVASDLIGRLVSFLLRKYHNTTAVDDIVRLQRALLRARVVLEEAEGRQVTNQAMLLQLKQLREEMCRGSYALDAFRRRAAGPKRRGTVSGCQSFSLPLGGGDGMDGALAVVESLEAALSDAKELVVLLGACPRVTRQPYSAYLFMEMCMFGRQMEKEHIIDFLLQPCSFGDPNLGVFPVIGPPEVGKRTLVEHVCIEERVRRHFSRIQRLSSNDLMGDHEHQGLNTGTSSAKSLFVIDLAGDVDEESWRRFRSSIRQTNRDSKIIIISRTEKHSSLGTVQPLMLGRLRQDELWYFFRALAFGSANPEEHPELVSIAMELFAGVRDFAPFAAVNILAASLRADLNARSWRRISRGLGQSTELQLRVHGREHDPEKCNFYLFMLVKDAPPCLFYDRRKSTASLARDELPKVRMQDLLTGVVVPGDQGKRFDVLVWQSRIPPFCSYVATCDVERAQQVVVVPWRKRLKRRRGQQQRH